jgi:hypothetical protein
LEAPYPWRDEGSASTLPPTFLFLQYSIFKEQTSQTRCRGPFRFWLRARQSVAHAALLDFIEGSVRSELLGRQRRAALVGEAYIVGGRFECQHAIRTFLNFLRRSDRCLFARRARAVACFLGYLAEALLRSDSAPSRDASRAWAEMVVSLRTGPVSLTCVPRTGKGRNNNSLRCQPKGKRRLACMMSTRR